MVSVPRRPFAGRRPSTPRDRWLYAGGAALFLHLAVLGVLLMLPARTPEDEARPESAVTLVLQALPAPSSPAPSSPASHDVEAPPVTPDGVTPEPKEQTEPPLQSQPLPTETRKPEPSLQPQPPQTQLSQTRPSQAQTPQTQPSQPKAPPQTLPTEAVPAPEMPLPPVPPPPPPSRPIPRAEPVRPRSAAAPPNASKPSSSPATPEPRPSEPVAALPSADVLDPYRHSLADHLRPYQRYPALSRIRHEQGLVVVHVTIQRDGQIAAMSIEHGSGFEALDREALATLKRADPLPPVPASIPGAPLELVFPLRFQLD